MNFLMDALEKAEEARPALDTHDADEPPLAFSSLDAEWGLIGSRIGGLSNVSMPADPARATRDGEDAAGSNDGRLSSRRTDAQSSTGMTSMETARGPVGSCIGEFPLFSMPADPIRATRDGEDAVGGGDGRSSSVQTDVRSAVRRTSVETAHLTFGTRDVPPRRRIGGTIGVTLLLLAVTAGGAVGGHHFWKVELARPALLRHPSPAPTTEAAPVWTAGVAANAARDSRIPELPGIPGSHGGPVPLMPVPLGIGSGATPSGHRAHSSESSGSGPVYRPAAQLVAQAGKPEARTTNGSPSGIADHLPYTMQHTGAESGVVETRVSRQQQAERPSQDHAGQHNRAASRPLPEAGASPTDPDAASRPFSGADTNTRPAPESGTVSRTATGTDTTIRPSSGAVIEITKRKRADHAEASLEQAYDAFQAGDVESAAEAYRAVLGYEPRNRDAFLGLAAVAARAGRWDEAAAYYTRVLALDPANAVAQAALIAIGEPDLVRGEDFLKEEGRFVLEGFLEEGLLKAESRLKTLLSGEPRAAYLHFGLGNVYAAQSRWPEAQQSFFNAYWLDRGNADCAYNLAVSLDHLSQPESALRFYREALALAKKRRPSFETAAVLARIRDLTTP